MRVRAYKCEIDAKFIGERAIKTFYRFHGQHTKRPSCSRASLYEENCRFGIGTGENKHVNTAHIYVLRRVHRICCNRSLLGNTRKSPSEELTLRIYYNITRFGGGGKRICLIYIRSRKKPTACIPSDTMRSFRFYYALRITRCGVYNNSVVDMPTISSHAAAVFANRTHTLYR